MIVQGNCGNYYRVNEVGSSQFWSGYGVKRDKKTGEWKPRARIIRPHLVRKSQSKIIEQKD